MSADISSWAEERHLRSRRYIPSKEQREESQSRLQLVRGSVPPAGVQVSSFGRSWDEDSRGTAKAPWLLDYRARTWSQKWRKALHGSEQSSIIGHVSLMDNSEGRLEGGFQGNEDYWQGDQVGTKSPERSGKGQDYRSDWREKRIDLRGKIQGYVNRTYNWN